MAEEEASGIAYFMRWEVPVSALIFLIPSAVAVILIRNRRRDSLRLVDLWMPCWGGLHPVWLLVYRVLVFVSMSSVLFVLALNEGAFVFYFYTQWTFTLVILYFALTAVMSARGCWSYARQTVDKVEDRNELDKRDSEESRSAASSVAPFIANETWGSQKFQNHHVCMDNEQRAGVLGYTVQIIYQTCAGAVMLTDIVFWGLLVPFLNDHFRVTPLMGCIHTLNAVFLLLDTAVNNMPFPLVGMAYFVLWSCAYVIFQWVLHACGFSWWPYPFLELATPWAPLWYFAIALVHIPCYGFYYLVVKAKNSLFGKWFPNAYIKSY